MGWRKSSYLPSIEDSKLGICLIRWPCSIKDGYWIFPAVDPANGHMQCIAPIGNDLYAIEPQNNAVSSWAVKSEPLNGCVCDA